jgi:hypothetical protein
MRSFIFLLSFLLLSACASKKQESDPGFGFAKKIFDIWKDVAKVDLPGAGPGGGEINIERSKLSHPYSMAVYFLPATEKDQNWKWERSEKDKFLSGLEKEKGTSRVFELINTSGPVTELSDLRYMAAQQGADTLLLVRGLAHSESKLNGKAASYILLVPMAVVNGNTVDSNFTAQAVLWDVKRPYVHLGAEAEGDWEMQRPLFNRQSERGVRKSREEALSKLQQKIHHQVQKI